MKNYLCKISDGQIKFCHEVNMDLPYDCSSFLWYVDREDRPVEILTKAEHEAAAIIFAQAQLEKDYFATHAIAV